ncbi:MAG: hypothetical protein ACKVOL_03460 [Novosphingobium sp.]
MIKRRAPNPELAGHPFRRTLPAHVLRPLPMFEPEVERAMAVLAASGAQLAEMRSPPVNPHKIMLQDVKDFLLAYCACFLAVSAFIF